MSLNIKLQNTIHSLKINYARTINHNEIKKFSNKMYLQINTTQKLWMSLFCTYILTINLIEDSLVLNYR